MQEVFRHSKMNESLGPDQGYHWTLWDARKENVRIPAEIIASSLATDKAPGDHRVVNVGPLIKKSCKGKLGN